MLFSDLTREFAEIEKTTLRNEMMVRLAAIIKRADPSEVTELVYLSMGELRPKYNKLEFNLADKMIVRAIARAAGKKAEEVAQEYKEKGDLGEVAENELGRVDEKAGTLTITAVYQELARIAEDGGVGSQERKIEKLANLLGLMVGRSAKYLVRMVLGRLRLGFSDKTLLDALSYLEDGTKEGREALDQAYQVAPDVGEIARLVKELGVNKTRTAVSIKIGRPMMPQLAQRLRTADEMIEKMGKVQVEPKYDGTRVQIHFSRLIQPNVSGHTVPQNGLFGETEKPDFWVRTFTRNLDESTDMFPELSRIHDQITAKEVILDSEAVGFEPQTGKLVPFQLTITRKRKHGVAQATASVPLRFFVFDILYKDGTSLLQLPLHERRAILTSTILKKGSDDVVVIDDAIVTDDPTLLREYHALQLKNGLEGAVVKKIEGKYLPGRQDWNWVKFKEEEGNAGKLSDTVDAVVMGYSKGKGKRQKFGVGAFLVGIKAEDDRIVTIAKIGTGLSDEQFAILFKKLESAEVKEKDPLYLVAKMLEPDVWVRPEIVVEIAADEVTKSPNHSSGYALRFPRLERFRDDKNADEITTLTELKEIAGV